MKNDPHTLHRNLETAEPTVIHHDDETALARWLRRGMEQGPKFWLLLGGSVVGLCLLLLLANALASGRSAASRAWVDLILARDADAAVKVSEANPNTEAGHWALLHAAASRYQEAINGLPGNREAARPLLNQAYDWYKKVEAQAPPGSILKRLAALGMARALEARGDDLAEAIRAYERIVQQKDWAGTPEVKRAEERIKLLNQPEVQAFYKQFASYTPKPPGGATSGLSGTSPAGSPAGMGTPGLPAGHPKISDLLNPPDLPLPPDRGAVATPAAPAADKPEIPADPFQKASPAPGGAAAPQPAAGAEPELPSKPFAPESEAPKPKG